jgi:hypothetical protein
VAESFHAAARSRARSARGSKGPSFKGACDPLAGRLANATRHNWRRTGRAMSSLRLRPEAEKDRHNCVG